MKSSALPSNPPPFLRPEDAVKTATISAFLGVSAVTVRRWRSQGRLPVASYTPGGQPLHRMSDVLRAAKPPARPLKSCRDEEVIRRLLAFYSVQELKELVDAVAEGRAP